MRVTLNMLTKMALDNLTASAARLLEAQDKASSGKRIHRPSDDVVGAGRAIRLRSALAAIEQFQRNGEMAETQLSITDNALNSVATALREVRTIAVTGANSTASEAARQAMAVQLDRITESLVSIANTKSLGKYIFSGSQTGNQPIIPNAGGVPPYIYQGDGEQFVIQVAPSTYLAANVTADKVFNMGGSAVPTGDVFETIRVLKAEILAGNVQSVSGRIADIDLVLNNVTAIRSQVGARLNRLQSTDEALKSSQMALADLLSKTEDADLAEAVLELRTRENAYQAAAAVASRILGMSLADYLE